MAERERPNQAPAGGASAPRAPAAAVLAQHEAIVGETLAEASAALARDGVDPAAFARAAIARAEEVAARLARSALPEASKWTTAGAAAGLIRARVSGSSMEAAGIRDGDEARADPARAPVDGDVVLAEMAGHGRLVVRLRMDGPIPVRLESANSAVAPIVVADPSALRIYGVVIDRVAGGWP